MNNVDKIKNQRETSSNTILQAIEACFLYIDSIKSKVFMMSKCKQKNEPFSDKNFYELMDMLDVFIQLISDIYRVLRKKHLSKDFCAKTVQDLEINMLFILKALSTAKHKKDFNMLMDLLEHELLENIIQWKIRVMPELKSTMRRLG